MPKLFENDLGDSFWFANVLHFSVKNLKISILPIKLVTFQLTECSLKPKVNYITLLKNLDLFMHWYWASSAVVLNLFSTTLTTFARLQISVDHLVFSADKTREKEKSYFCGCSRNILFAFFLTFFMKIDQVIHAIAIFDPQKKKKNAVCLQNGYNWRKRYLFEKLNVL